MKIFVLILWMIYPHSAPGNAVAVCITATGRYLDYALEFIHSAEKFFLKKHSVDFFIFSDGISEYPSSIKYFYWPQLGWPLDTMQRTAAYICYEKEFIDYEWVFAVDADTLCVDEIGDEILGATVGVLHGGFTEGRGTWESNPCSAAFVPEDMRRRYFAGGFFGGERDRFFAICHACQFSQIRDQENEYLAVWHDESHLNRYFAFFPPEVVLGGEYCARELKKNKPGTKMIARKKNHEFLRMKSANPIFNP